MDLSVNVLSCRTDLPKLSRLFLEEMLDQFLSKLEVNMRLTPKVSDIFMIFLFFRLILPFRCMCQLFPLCVYTCEVCMYAKWNDTVLRVSSQLSWVKRLFSFTMNSVSITGSNLNKMIWPLQPFSIFSWGLKLGRRSLSH